MVTSSIAVRGWCWLEQAVFQGGQMDAFSGFSNYITMGGVLGLCRGRFWLFRSSFPTSFQVEGKKLRVLVVIIFKLL